MKNDTQSKLRVLAVDSALESLDFMYKVGRPVTQAAPAKAAELLASAAGPYKNGNDKFIAGGMQV